MRAGTGFALGRSESSLAGSVATGPTSDGTVGSTNSLVAGRVRRLSDQQQMLEKKGMIACSHVPYTWQQVQTKHPPSSPEWTNQRWCPSSIQMFCLSLTCACFPCQTHSPVDERLNRGLRLPLQVLFAVSRQSAFVYLVRVHHQQISKVKLKDETEITKEDKSQIAGREGKEGVEERRGGTQQKRQRQRLQAQDAGCSMYMG